MPKLNLTLLKKPTAEALALMVERITGKRPSDKWLEETRAKLAERAAKGKQP
jgi:hypothetical protein